MRMASLALMAALVFGAPAHAAPAPGAAEFEAAEAAYKSKDYPRAKSLYEQAAAKGHAGAMLNIGFMHRFAEGVPRDDVQAAAWYRKAADAGQLTAAHNLASLYRRGIGVPQDHAEALRLFLDAAGKGHADSAAMAGFMYQHGEGVAADPARAAELYRQATRGGSSVGMFNLAALYERGEGVPQNAKAARVLFLRSALNGREAAVPKFAELEEAAKKASDAEAQALFQRGRHMRNIASDDKEHAEAKIKAFPLFLEAAELGYMPAMGEVQLAYRYGEGVPKDPKKVREWVHVMAELGSASSQTMLAQYLRDGVGWPKDVRGARFWFEKAALQGNTLAMFYLAQLYDGQHGHSPNHALATHWYITAYNKGSVKAENVLKARGLLKPPPEASAFIERIHRDGPNRQSSEAYTLDVAIYCKYGGPRCHELSLAARQFEKQHNAGAAAANMQRLWNTYSTRAPDADQRARERSQCLQKTTEALQRYTYGQQDWYYADTC